MTSLKRCIDCDASMPEDAEDDLCDACVRGRQVEETKFALQKPDEWCQGGEWWRQW